MENYFKYIAVAFFTAFLVILPSAIFAQTAPYTTTPGSQALVEPMITVSPDSFNSFEEVLYIAGRANPNALVAVLIEREDKSGAPVKFTVYADSLGEWVVSGKTYLNPGYWNVRARQQINSLISDWSNPRIIRSIAAGVNVYGLQIRYVTIASIILVFLIVLTVVFIYFRRKIGRLQQGLKEKQLKEAEDRFHKGFAEIRKNLMDQLKELAANSEGRALTREELEKRDRVLKELEDLEQNLDHDFGEISRR